MAAMTGMDEINAERCRQVEAEGFDTSHDDDLHGQGDLWRAAQAYENNAMECAGADGEPPSYWPWDRKWWKPKDARRDLVRAGALYAAEAERHERQLAAYRTLSGYRTSSGPSGPTRRAKERDFQRFIAIYRDSARRCAEAVDVLDARAVASA